MINSIFQVIYRRRKARSLERKKPMLAWFPKYRVSVRLPVAVTQSPSPAEELEALLAASGFKLDCCTKEAIHFTRGKSWGDFSIELMRLRLSFPTPLLEYSEMILEVADVCLFDTGDLWVLANELAESLKNAVSANKGLNRTPNPQIRFRSRPV